MKLRNTRREGGDSSDNGMDNIEIETSFNRITGNSYTDKRRVVEDNPIKRYEKFEQSQAIQDNNYNYNINGKNNSQNLRLNIIRKNRNAEN